MNIDEYSMSLSTFGRLSRAVVPSDETDLPGGPAKAIVLVTDGSVAFLPAENADNDPVTFTDRPAGFMPPFIVRRVLATGTTATVRTIEN